MIAVAGINPLSNEDAGVLGAGGEGDLPLAQFAVPDARSDLEGDANIAQDDCESAGIPCPEDGPADPGLRGARCQGAIRVCDLFDRPLVLSFWFTRGGDCEAQEDVFEAAYRRFGDRVNFLAIDVRDDTRRGPSPDHRARLDPPGRSRPRRRPLQPLPDRRLPDLRLCLPRWHPGGDHDRRARPAAALDPGRAADRGLEGARRETALDVPAKKKPAQRKPAKREAEPVAALPEEWEAAPEPGWVDPALAGEFPGPLLLTTTLGVGSGRSPAALKERLRTLSDRFGGAQAIMLRQRPIPWAYRVFFRHIGLDPDQTPTPVEQLALDRMKSGRFRSQNRLDDALTIAMVEVGVALLAFDADRVEGPARPAALGRGRAVRGPPLAAARRARS